MKLINKVLLAVSLIATSVAATPVDNYGQIRVGTSGSTKGTLVDENGNKVQLKGMSMFWNDWSSKYWNANVVTNMAKDWNVNIVRAAVGASNKTKTDYLYSSSSDDADAETIVNAAIDAGIYVIIDWHGHYANFHKADAKAFFGKMAQKYGKYPNVIYEVWNEPKDSVNWANDIQPYAQEILDEIRKYDTDNIVIAGTQNWCQKPLDVNNNRLTYKGSTDPNVMYTIHVYASSHTNETIKNEFNSALTAKIPLFMTEWGTCDASGDGSFDKTNSQWWIDWMKSNNISWCNWAVNDKDEAASALKESAPTNGKWTASNLTTTGEFILNYIKDNNPSYSGVNSPVITLISPTSVAIGSSYIVKYEATDKEDGILTNAVIKTGSVNTSVAGAYDITLSVSDIDGNKTTKTFTIKVTSNILPIGYVVLDDFENSMNDANNQSYLGARFNYFVSETDKYFNAGYWYVYDDIPDGGSSYASPNYIKDKDFTTIETVDTYNGNQALKVKMYLGEAFDQWGSAHYGVGCNLTEDGNYTDLRNMTSVSFYAKGSGSMTAKFITKEADDYSSDWGHYQHGFTLTSSWKKYTLYSSNFIPSPDSDLEIDGNGFKGYADRNVQKLAFQTNGGEGDVFTFAIDDIQLNGVEYTDFQWGNNVINDGTPIDTNSVQIEEPTVTLTSAIAINVGDSYAITYSAVDAKDANITQDVIVSGAVNTAIAGLYPINLKVTDSDNNTTVESYVIEVIKINTSKKVLIDDFEDYITYQTYLGTRINAADVNATTDAGQWYTYDDSNDGGNSSATPDYYQNTFGSQQSSVYYEGKGGLELDIDLGDAIDGNDGAYYGLGFSIAGDYIDCSNLTAITFYAKGSGSMMIKLRTQATDTYTWGDMAVYFTLTPSWKKYTINAADFKPEVKSPSAAAGVTWNRAKGYVYKLHFQTDGKAGENIIFAVDNIVFEGMDDSEFYPTLKSEGGTEDNVIGNAPVISSITDVDVQAGEAFNAKTDISFFANDKEDGNLTNNVTFAGTVDTDLLGTYIVVLQVTDSDGNTTSNKVNVNVITPTAVNDFTPNDEFNIDDLVVGAMPITESSKIFYNTDEAGEYTLELYTISEQLVGTTKVTAKKGKNVTTWSTIHKLSRGVYYIALKKNDKRVALTRIVKAN